MNGFYAPCYKSFDAYEPDLRSVVEIWEGKVFISDECPNPNLANELSMTQLAGLIGNLRTDVEKLKSGN